MARDKMPTIDPSTPIRVFTVAQANAMLPLIRAITRDLVELSREVVERHERVEHLKAGREILPGDPYHDELAQIEDELAKDRRRLNRVCGRAAAIGRGSQERVEGIVDFPSTLDGELVYLCWKLGEEEVLYWHPMDAGYAGRQPLATASVADASDSDA